MKMYKIIPNEKRITEITYDGSYDEMRKHIKYHILDHCRINGMGDMVFVNDVGLLDNTAILDGYFYVKLPNAWIMLIGEALYWGTDREGENASPHNTIEQLENIISWSQPPGVSIQ